jgi:DivIVA domain-containing protein
MPEERRMTITSSPHLTPDDVARHTFASVRRGFDPAEVRDYLESIATGLRGLAEREQELQGALADAEERAANPVIDDSMLTAAVGKETARVLQSAHDAAAEMVGNAEAEAHRMMAEATTVSERLVAEATEVSEQAQARADALLAERLAEAEAAAASLQERTEAQVTAALDKVRADAEELTERARAEGRQMVEEAQALRARVLEDLARRRKVLHAQIDQLRAGRERLAETVNDVRRSVEAIAEDVFKAEDEARLAAEVAGREAAARPDEGTPEELAALLLAEEADPGTHATVPEAGRTPGADGGAAPDDGVAATDGAPAPAAASTAADDGGADEPVAASGETGADDSAADAAETTAAAPPVEKVDALFAKLRAAQDGGDATEGAAAAPGADGPSVDTEPATTADRATRDGDRDEDEDEDRDEEGSGPPDARDPRAVRRDDLVAPLVTGLARRLKRSLQDNQNDLLDRLRAKGTSWSPDLLPDETEQVDAIATAALPLLEEAADAGAAFAGAEGPRPATDALLAIGHELAESIVGPLRKRLASDDDLASAEESAVTEHIGSAFREWKGERIERIAGDHVVAAFSLGSLAAAGAVGTPIEWVAVAGPDEAPCPDCEDNGLNGAQSAGEEFPTGHVHPPAHPGCRCLLAATTP